MNVDEHTAIYYIYIKSLNFNSISSLIFKIEVILNIAQNSWFNDRIAAYPLKNLVKIILNDFNILKL